MATTTNFGWETPDDTDLVKDGALAMRTLGNAIDTSLVDLKGGTTGQVLSKTSNTDMDFTWVTSDDANAIQNTIVDAKGDLVTATGSDVPARLAVGNNGDTLLADSSTSTGLRWSPAPSTGNPVINSAMQIWQRGTTNVTTASAYTADRWQKGSGTHFGVSRQTTSDTTNLPFIQYCARIQRTAGNTTTTGMDFAQNFESSNSIPYAGRTVTLSFYVRKGADYSSVTSNVSATLYTGTGTDQNIITGFTGSASTLTVGGTVTTTWQRFSASATLPTNMTQMAIYVIGTPSGTAGANDYYEVTGFQIDLGSVALPFRTYASTLQGELGAAQRYYYRQGGDAIFSRFGQGYATSTVNVSVTLNQPTTMRVAPTAVDFSTLTVGDGVNAYTVTGLTIDQAGKNVTSLNAAVASGLTQFRPYGCGANNSTSAFIGLSAEL